ncbi:putative d-alanyl-d-alanine carboxypeptidase protein [Mycena venus]|uniref:Putative d-alanyl-d-alanine carboxypeptidase protein n=1 Tax=Mycena venus TaxID=2733690 RepID=A0A8H7CMH6_9AGAR|nr:putative d-alanyl-d-alanine carboxypeptidase protein [Mycena venus]
MKIVSFLVLLTSMASTQASLNGPCTGGGLDPGVGVCLHTSTCTADGGTIHNNLCPFDPPDVKCCTNRKAPKCDNQNGICRFTDTCTGKDIIIPNLCPSPNNFKCCITPCSPGKRDEESVELDKRIGQCP